MNGPTRRRLLAATSAGVLAGCLESARFRSLGGDPVPSGDPDPKSCPAYGDRVDRVVCYDDTGDVGVVLEPGVERVANGESIEFTLENGTGRRLVTNFYDWRVDKYVDGAWHHVAPLQYNQPAMELRPGEGHTWTATVDRGGLDDGEPSFATDGIDELTLSAVGGGTYAFRARGRFEDESHEDALAFAATFDVEGDPLELSPSDAVAETGWDDGVLVAEPVRGGSDRESRARETFEVERLADLGEAEGNDEVTPGGPKSVIAEQLFRRPRLRDAIAIAFEHDADRVRLEEETDVDPVFATSDGIYAFRGEHYRVETRELEE